MYSDVTNNLVYTRISTDNGKTWSNWVRIITSDSLPSDLARTSQLANFTGGLQKGGKDVATTADVTNAVNSATANVVTTNKLANFTAGLQSGGVDVATKSDIPSNTNDPRVDKLINNLAYVILDITANVPELNSMGDTLTNQLRQGL
uniref:hypothetical protein n=1 Tax=Lentilactobacillus hilgardii TaxID=1588 RepID=UPI00403EFC35